MPRMVGESAAKKKKRLKERAERDDRRHPSRRKPCKLCGDKVAWLDYKDVSRLQKFTSERGKILPSRVSGNCASHQRQLARAVKRARQVALMPYIAE